MFRRFFSKPRPTVVRQTFRPCLEGLEARLTPATASFNNTTKTLTVKVEIGDTSLDFSQAPNLPAGYITVEDQGGFIFNDPTGGVGEKFVKNIVVKIPASVAGPIDIEVLGIGIAGNFTVTSATDGGVDVEIADSAFGNVKITSSAVAADDIVDLDTVALKGTLTVSLGGSTAANTVIVDNVSIGGDLNVTGKNQVDNVFLNDVVAAGKTIINLGGGANSLVQSGVLGLSKSLSYTGTSGVDDIEFTGVAVVGGSTSFKLGDGANVLDLTPVDGVFSKNLSVTGGVAVDDIDVGPGVLIGGDATFNLGDSAAEQNLDIIGSVVLGNLAITGGSNFDNVVLLGLNVRGTTTVKLLGGNDILDIDDSIFIGKALFDGGAGNDDFFIQDAGAGLTSFGGKLTIKGGDGDDDLTLGDTATGTLTVNGATTVFDGGAGTNVFTDALEDLFDNGTPPTNNWV